MRLVSLLRWKCVFVLGAVVAGLALYAFQVNFVYVAISGQIAILYGVGALMLFAIVCQERCLNGNCSESSSTDSERDSGDDSSPP
ncbi:MAG: hypothetical protein V5A19_05700 [Thiohalorhabdus sp.]